MAKRVGVDKWLFGVTVLLVFIGLLMVFSASAVMANERYGSPYTFVSKQAGWAVLGLIAMTVLMQIDYRKYNRPAVVFPAVAITTAFAAWRFPAARLAQYAPLDSLRRFLYFSAIGDCQAGAGAVSRLVPAG